MAGQLISNNRRLRGFIIREFFSGKDPSAVADDTPLRGLGILNEMTTLALVSYVERTWDIEVTASEASDEFRTIADIAALIERKSRARRVVRVPGPEPARARGLRGNEKPRKSVPSPSVRRAARQTS